MVFDKRRFLLLKRSLVVVCSLNLITSLIVAIVADSLANSEIDALRPKAHYPQLIKHSIFRALLYAFLLAVLINLLGIYATVKENKPFVTTFLVLGIIATLHNFYIAIFESRSNRGLYWFNAVWTLLATGVTGAYWSELRKKWNSSI